MLCMDVQNFKVLFHQFSSSSFLRLSLLFSLSSGPKIVFPAHCWPRYENENGQNSNVDMSSLRAQWKNGLYKKHSHRKTQKHAESKTHQTFSKKLFFFCVFWILFFYFFIYDFLIFSPRHNILDQHTKTPRCVLLPLL